MSETEKQVCNACQGSGKCLRCHGTGSITQHLPSPITVISGQVPRESQTSRTCTRCYGSGMCDVCKGTGKPA